MERRELIRFLLATAGLKCLDGFMPDELLAFGAHVHQRLPDGVRSSGVLDAHAHRTVVIAAERIIPAWSSILRVCGCTGAVLPP